MINKIIKHFDRTMVLCVIVTSIILNLYSHIVFYIYILGLILLIIIIYGLDDIGGRKLNSALKYIFIGAIVIFCITIMGEIWLHLYPHRLTGIGGIDTVGEFSDYTSRGYLTEEVFQKRPDVVRILGLGDSFAVYLKDKGKNYHNILQEKYLAKGKETVEIINAGMEGIGPGYYWHILNKFGDLFKPDLVLVSFFIGNDFHEAGFDLVIGGFIREPEEFTRKYSEYYQFRKWRLYKLFRNKYLCFREAHRKSQEVKSLPPEQIGTFSQDTFLEIESETIWMFEKHGRKELQQKWQQCSDIILKMNEWCVQRKVKLVIIISPDQFQIDHKLKKNIINQV